jgi:hypothetical protein
MATLTVSFIPPNPVPANGFIVKYRKVGDSTYTRVLPNPTTAPVFITVADSSVSYEGIVQSDCGSGFTCPEISFTIAPTCNGINRKLVGGICEIGIKTYIGSTANTSGGYSCSYYYVFSDGSHTNSYIESNPAPCTLGAVVA